VKGFTGQRSEILQWYWLGVDEGADDVTPPIERSLEAIKRRGKGMPGAGARGAGCRGAARAARGPRRGARRRAGARGGRARPAARARPSVDPRTGSWTGRRCALSSPISGSRCQDPATDPRSIPSPCVTLWPTARQPTPTMSEASQPPAEPLFWGPQGAGRGRLPA
jgi:hypothetical protein